MSGALRKARWFAIRTLPKLDRQAEENLRRQGFRVFIPRAVRTVRHARKIEARKVQLFPGYGFVELELTQQGWRSINGTRGVAHLIVAGERPVPLPQGVVEELLDVADASGVCDLSRKLAVGDQVRLCSGPFSGAVGLLTGLDEVGRVDILLKIMNGQIRIKAAQEALEVAN